MSDKTHTDYDDLCRAAKSGFNRFPAGTISEDLDSGFRVGAGLDLIVDIHVWDLYDPDDPGDRFDSDKLSESNELPLPDTLEDHTSVLDSILAGLQDSPLGAEINGLTTDGDNHDCEAIFWFRDQPWIIKVRE